MAGAAAMRAIEAEVERAEKVICLVNREAISTVEAKPKKWLLSNMLYRLPRCYSVENLQSASLSPLGINTRWRLGETLGNDQ